MQPLTASPDHLDALAQGRAAVDLSRHRKVRVRGDDARRWLHDLVTADVASLEPGTARRSLLLDPTGHIRADLHVACNDEGFWLFQDAGQPEPVDAALAPFVLSSDVRLDDLTDEIGLIGLPGASGASGASGGPSGFRPSLLGVGRDLLTMPGSVPKAIGERVLVDADAVEVWRIRSGNPRMGVDFGRTTIPAEAGLDAAIDETKGCFLGQESVARVRNLGHPPRLLRHLEAQGLVPAGSALRTGDGREAGLVTSSAAADGGGSVVLATIPWALRDESVVSADGVPLVPVGSSD
jgi:folate-binding protein YgfZ